LDRLDRGSLKINRVEIGVVWLCRIKTYEDYFKLGFMAGIWKRFIEKHCWRKDYYETIRW
jgi:hypothetical protein